MEITRSISNLAFNLKHIQDKSSAWGYNWATLFLGNLNTGTWPSRLGESQMRQ
jgi:hypothetical protein